jgi:magnesium chelatase family protein
MSVWNSIFGKEPKKKIRKKVVRRIVVKQAPICIGEVRGQDNTKVGLLIAACGRHNALLIGPPGEGKSFLISTVEGFLPDQTSKEERELYEVLRSVDGGDTKCDVDNSSYSTRPVIEVAPTITQTAMLGGGRIPMPGCVSRAHSGMLFMDEFPEYDRGLLESLRAVMEDGDITIARGGQIVTYPADFQLVCAMNPCPCGYLGTTSCTCTDKQVLRYQGKLSGPILDRLDMVLGVGRITAKQKFKDPVKNQTREFKRRIDAATKHRLDTRDQSYPNKSIPGHKVFVTESDIFNWTDESLQVFMKIIDGPKFSTRKSIRLARVSRTIADLHLEESITSKHLELAIRYVSNNLLG